MRAVGLAVALMLCGAAVCEASPNVPAPEPVPVRRAKKADADVTACEVDICGSKGFSSPADGKVNVHDLLKFLMAMEQHGDNPPMRQKSPADYNDDGHVDVMDLLLLFKRFGATCQEREEAAKWHFGERCKTPLAVAVRCRSSASLSPAVCAQAGIGTWIWKAVSERGAEKLGRASVCVRRTTVVL